MTEGPISMAIINLGCSFWSFQEGIESSFVILNLETIYIYIYIYIHAMVLQTSSLLFTLGEMSLGRW